MRANTGRSIGCLLLVGGALAARPAVGITRCEVVARAERWVAAAVPYSWDAWYTEPSDGEFCYGSDCSALVSAAWDLPPPGLTTYSFAGGPWDSGQSYVIVASDLLPGDALNYPGDLDAGTGHIMLYISGDFNSGWVEVIEEYDFGQVAEHRWRSITTSLYLPIRYNDIEPCSAPTTGTIKGSVFVDHGSGTADMSERLPGATVSASDGSSTTARAGDGIWSLALNAGDYTITASMAGYQSASRSCGAVAGGETWCSIGLVPVCTPDCSSRACGTDPVCGVTCGSCGSDEQCDTSGQCAAVDAGAGADDAGKDSAADSDAGDRGADDAAGASAISDPAEPTPPATDWVSDSGGCSAGRAGSASSPAALLLALLGCGMLARQRRAHGGRGRRQP